MVKQVPSAPARLPHALACGHEDGNESPYFTPTVLQGLIEAVCTAALPRMTSCPDGPLVMLLWALGTLHGLGPAGEGAALVAQHKQLVQAAARTAHALLPR